MRTDSCRLSSGLYTVLWHGMPFTSQNKFKNNIYIVRIKSRDLKYDIITLGQEEEGEKTEERGMNQLGDWLHYQGQIDSIREPGLPTLSRLPWHTYMHRLLNLFHTLPAPLLASSPSPGTRLCILSVCLTPFPTSNHHMPGALLESICE